MDLLERIARATMDYTYEPVPPDKTTPSWRMFGVWFGVIVNLALMNFGITMSRVMPLREALLSFMIGQVILSTLFAISGVIGTRTRLPLGALIRVTFGNYGASLVLIAVALTLMGWFAFQLELFAGTLQNLLDVTSSNLMRSLFILSGGLLMITTAAIGFRAVAWIAQLATPLLLITLAYAVVHSYLAHHGFRPIEIAPADRLSFGSALSIVLGGNSLGLLIISDVSRYGRSIRGTMAATWSSFVFGGGFVFLVSILLGRISQGSDLAAIVPDLGKGVVLIAVPCLLLATWTTNDPNVYVASLAVVSILKSRRRWLLALSLGLIGIGITLIGIVSHFLSWLSLIGMVFAPAGAVFMLDYFLHPHQYENAHEKEMPNFRLPPALAWLTGSIVSYLTTKSAELGAGVVTLTTVPAADGLLAASIVYLVLTSEYVSLETPGTPR
jgi:cytosine permease